MALLSKRRPSWASPFPVTLLFAPCSPSLRQRSKPACVASSKILTFLRRRGDGESHDILAAIHPDDVTRHPVGFRAAQDDKRCGNVLGRSEAAGRIALQRGLDDLLVSGDLPERGVSVTPARMAFAVIP